MKWRNRSIDTDFTKNEEKQILLVSPRRNTLEIIYIETVDYNLVRFISFERNSVNLTFNE